METSPPTIVLFSGGRDSSLAALRLAEEGKVMTLLTVTSNHLYGIDKVQQRVEEIWKRMPIGSSWIRVKQPIDFSYVGLSENTCLPCQRDYALCGIIAAKKYSAQEIAFGYASYQSDWPEQSLNSISRLRKIVEENGLRLILPVYSIASKEAAKDELAMRGFNEESLEQKCIKQVTNITLSEEQLTLQLNAWEKSFRQRITEVVELEMEILQS